MMAECTSCQKPFDTHEGGSCCSVCAEAFCPECEQTMDLDENQDPVCPSCQEAYWTDQRERSVA